MAPHSWSNRYATGLRAIDDDHRGLFELVDALEEHHEKASSSSSVAATIAALQVYAAEHFAREERFMHKAHFPDFERHHRIHEDFRALVDALARFQDQSPDSVDLGRVTRFLNRWIGEHILVKDMEYLPYVTGEAAGTPHSLEKPALTDLMVHVPVEKRDAVIQFAALLTEGGEIAEALEQALSTRLRQRFERFDRQAHALFERHEPPAP
ncbi:hemerythrin [Rhodospirillum rubrum]|uniref:bacteriohemerythrin n=1 Tax=Rhodospirillum rubrum TaxID=1085 RepID=UPI0019041588|nr:bacteriohemerythrin [Rhodospirillum rubrum]MBK1664625.1 hemerythrin [Rhodospirillum rubrum]MBK1676306.1 hemerythrin [Rhodospirillum rubrum]